MRKGVVNAGFRYVVESSKLYNIDESHDLNHSMKVYGLTKN